MQYFAFVGLKMDNHSSGACIFPTGLVPKDEKLSCLSAWTTCPTHCWMFHNVPLVRSSCNGCRGPPWVATRITMIFYLCHSISRRHWWPCNTGWAQSSARTVSDVVIDIFSKSSRLHWTTAPSISLTTVSETFMMNEILKSKLLMILSATKIGLGEAVPLRRWHSKGATVSIHFGKLFNQSGWPWWLWGHR